MPKILKKIIKLILNTLVTLVFAVLIFVIFIKVKMLVKHENNFELFGYSVFNVATGSMQPAIMKDDVIIVKKTNDYKVGDIVTFKKESDYITHRIIEKNAEYIVTQGDANNAKDVAIKEDLIVGEVIKIYQGAGIWQKILTTPSVIIMIFVTLILFDLAFSYKGIKTKQLVKKVENVDLEKVVKGNKEINLTKEEITELYNKMTQIKDNEDIELNDKEEDLLNYTIRLDLTELQKEINNKLKGE